ncbi:uncharacterized protein K02A2.6-like [Monomorium pharaonis]|uniref:uncharacterized protein K02A2.6-like n=1 Tax=Monomorium pharaonis TaxID=307658 RepID=UPI00063FA06B|nr:uncharacterized protein K02A2.6-like [Monomorium pharaonis]
MELYQSIIESRQQTVEQRKAILDTIQGLALKNFQLGLKEEIQTIVRFRNYDNLSAAILGAFAEEKLKGSLTRQPLSTDRNRNGQKYSRGKNPSIQCHKCGKTGHIERENKSKAGHKREKCWSLHGRPERERPRRSKREVEKERQVNTTAQARKRKDNRKSDEESFSSSSKSNEEEKPKKRKTQAAHTDATITLLKVGNLKSETPIHEECMTLTGVTGHKIHTLRKLRSTIKLGDKEIRHTVYVVKDDFSIDYEGIHGIDFLKKHSTKCDHGRKQMRISNATLKLRPFQKFKLAPRSETVIQVSTDQNRIDHLNSEEKEQLQEICKEFCDIFRPPRRGCFIVCTNAVEHEISTRTDSASVNVRPYRLPEKHKIKVNRQIQEMLEQEIIRPSTSQWNAPLLVVPKKPDASGKLKYRVVIDFRKLNNLTIEDSFPLPNIIDILAQLGNAKYFTTLDLAFGYHQITVAEKDKNKTAFSTSYGHYEYNRMPFGLKNVPATFQWLMNIILTGVQGPLTKLTEKGEKFRWMTEQQNAFEILKEKLITAPVLSYPDFEKECVVTTDALDYAIGAVLSQGSVGSDQPIAYASRILNKTERNYNTTEKELLAIVWAVNFDRKGNVNADALSQYLVTDSANVNAITPAEEREEATREYTEKEKRQILFEYHDAPIGGHQGVARTLNRIRLMHNWRGITRDIEEDK